MTFAYHRSVAPMMWVLVGIAGVELIVTHVLVALLWSPWPALALSAVTLAGIAWLARGIAMMRDRPVLLDERRLVMRVGTLKGVEVPVERVAGLWHAWDAAAIKSRDVLNLALIAYPNVVVGLDAPLPGRRGIRAIAHRLDDPAAFAAAIARLEPIDSQRPASPAEGGPRWQTPVKEHGVSSRRHSHPPRSLPRKRSFDEA